MGSKEITFEKLTVNAIMDIFTLNGELVNQASKVGPVTPYGMDAMTVDLKW